MRTTTSLGSFALLAILVTSTAASAGSAPLPSWNQRITNGKRFSVPKQWDGTAVFDKETGLLWQRAPVVNVRYTWEQAVLQCAGVSLAERKGWHLPSIVELESLLDTVVDGLQDTGSFLVGVRQTYWSSTPHLSDPTKAYVVDLTSGELRSDLRSATYPVFCVRGPVNLGAP
jgi:uncharacterized protein DUF1566